MQVGSDVSLCPVNASSRVEKIVLEYKELVNAWNLPIGEMMSYVTVLWQKYHNQSTCWPVQMIRQSPV